MILVSLGVMGLPLQRKSMSMSLQNKQDDGISQQTVDSSGTIEHMKVSNLERSEGEGTLVMVRQRPP